jgi:Gpi18-like mannosyltransferase
MFVKRFDVLLLLVLVTARLRIDTLADLVAPRPIEVIRKVPWLSGLLPEQGWTLLFDFLTDPLSLVLISVTIGLVLAYVLIDAVGTPDAKPGRSANETTSLPHFRVKLALVFAIIASTVIAQSLYLVSLRHVAGPASYTHDGGVIQTEEAIKFILQGKNPYVEDYTKTPMAEWGLDLRTALYHYPYLPWTFVFSLPFYQFGTAVIGWFDERLVYLTLFVLMLVMATRLSANRSATLAIVMVLGLNPIMGSDVIFGQNDSFVLFWLVAALWAAGRTRPTLRGFSPILFALACASKPTAWFLVPFFFLFWAGEGSDANEGTRSANAVGRLRRLVPFAVVMAVVVLPFVLWDPYNFYDDVWAWSAGTSPTAYQIRGWGLSNFVLALNLVPTRVAYFPFWIPEALVAVPLFIVLLRRQWLENTLANVAWHGGVLLFAYAYASRFLNENYLGFIVGLLLLGALMGNRPAISSTDS